MVHFLELAHKGSLNNCIESNYAVYRSIYVKASFQSNRAETEVRSLISNTEYSRMPKIYVGKVGRPIHAQS